MKIVEISLVFVLAIYVVFNEISHKKERTYIELTFKLYLPILVGIIVLFNNYSDWKDNELNKQIDAKIGDFNSTDIAYRPKIILGNPESPMQIIGNAESHLDLGKPISGVDSLDVVVLENKLIVNTCIRNFDGKVIAYITNNTWEILNDEFEYNNDETSLEIVRKGERDVFFHLELTKGQIQIEGYLFSKNKKGFFAESLGKGKGGNFLLAIDTLVEKNSIKPIFKYPRSKYYGVRI
jgi:hypothetical protein